MYLYKDNNLVISFPNAVLTADWVEINKTTVGRYIKSDPPGYDPKAIPGQGEGNLFNNQYYFKLVPKSIK